MINDAVNKLVQALLFVQRGFDSYEVKESMFPSISGETPPSRRFEIYSQQKEDSSHFLSFFYISCSLDINLNFIRNMSSEDHDWVDTLTSIQRKKFYELLFYTSSSASSFIRLVNILSTENPTHKYGELLKYATYRVKDAGLATSYSYSPVGNRICLMEMSDNELYTVLMNPNQNTVQCWFSNYDEYARFKNCLSAHDILHPCFTGSSVRQCYNAARAHGTEDALKLFMTFSKTDLDKMSWRDKSFFIGYFRSGSAADLVWTQLGLSEGLKVLASKSATQFHADVRTVYDKYYNTSIATKTTGPEQFLPQLIAKPDKVIMDWLMTSTTETKHAVFGGVDYWINFYNANTDLWSFAKGWRCARYVFCAAEFRYRLISHCKQRNIEPGMQMTLELLNAARAENLIELAKNSRTMHMVRGSVVTEEMCDINANIQNLRWLWPSDAYSVARWEELLKEILVNTVFRDEVEEREAVAAWLESFFDTGAIKITKKYGTQPLPPTRGDWVAQKLKELGK